jgi:hypothetical protein
MLATIQFRIFSLPVSYLKTLMVKIYKTILPILYVCVTCCITVREEHMLRVFENRVLRRIFGPKRKWQKAAQ